jgi:dsDNA-specific endonuclease/ATPase MutS2
VSGTRVTVAPSSPWGKIAKRAVFEVVEGPNARGEFLVISGIMKLWVAAEALTLAAEKPKKRPTPTHHELTPRIKIDLHGMTGDQAERALIEALDRAILKHSEGLEVNHGIGNGILKERVHRYLATYTGVTRFGIDPRNPGVTVVVL